jgi:transcriptional regulator with XRE-family HTH domain
VLRLVVLGLLIGALPVVILVRKLRRERGWKQVYMAEHIGMDRSFISDLENGKKEICIRNLQILARAFEITISQLMTRL